MTTPRGEVADILADWRGDAAVLRRRGDARLADALEKCADEIRDAADEFVTLLSEADAMKRSGKSGDAVRKIARQYLQSGHAFYDAKKRSYLLRACIVPRRVNVEMIRADAEQAS